MGGVWVGGWGAWWQASTPWGGSGLGGRLLHSSAGVPYICQPAATRRVLPELTLCGIPVCVPAAAGLQFATVLMAITGEAFMDAGRHVTDLLLRNLLNAFASTVWFTPLVIRLACLTMSAGWGLLSGGAYYYLHRSSALEATPGLNASVLGVSVFVVTQFVLSFIGGILLSVLDAGGQGGQQSAAGMQPSWRCAPPHLTSHLTHPAHTPCEPSSTGLPTAAHTFPVPLATQCSFAGQSIGTARRCHTPRSTQCSRRCPSLELWWSSQMATSNTARARRRPATRLRRRPPTRMSLPPSPVSEKALDATWSRHEVLKRMPMSSRFGTPSF